MFRRTTATFCLAGLASLSFAQSTWYVDLQGTPPGVGTLANPYTSVQYAIEQASTLAGDTLLVAPGTYLERIDYSGKSLVIEASAGAAVTILDAAGSGTVVTCSSGEALGTSLRGFSLRNGAGSPSSQGLRGGGLIVRNAALELVGCTIEQCQADLGGAAYLELADVLWNNCTIADITCGGGIYALSLPRLEFVDCTLARVQPTTCAILGQDLAALQCAFSTLTLTNTIFEDNKAYSPLPDPTEASGLVLESCTTSIFGGRFAGHGVDSNFPFDIGGAILAQGGTLVVDGTVFEGNAAETRGGALALRDVQLTLTNALLSHNQSADAYAGGALYVSDQANSKLFVQGTRFEHNAAGEGGALYLGAGSAHFVDCIFAENEALALYDEIGAGGAAYCAPIASLNFERCLFRENRAFGNIFLNPLEGHGGALYGPANVDRSTLVDNQAFGEFVSGQGGGAYGAFLSNSILRSNGPDQLQGAASAEWSNIEDGFPGTGNIDLDPLFWDAGGSDYHLLGSSPCIDGGDPLVFDQDGSRVDMGAFPFVSAYCGVARAYCSAKQNSQACLPSIGSSGTPSLQGANDFFITATQVINKQNGMLIWSAGPKSLPFFGGTLCIASPIVRTAIQNSGGNKSGSDCSGTLSFHFSEAYMQQRGLNAFDTIHAQYWYRDPMGSFGVGLTDALRFVICAGG